MLVVRTCAESHQNAIDRLPLALQHVLQRANVRRPGIIRRLPVGDNDDQ